MAVTSGFFFCNPKNVDRYWQTHMGEFGSLVRLDRPLQGPWIQQAVSRMSQLHLEIDGSAAVTLSRASAGTALGLRLADFLYRSYISKIHTTEYGQYLDVQNIVLDKCGGNQVDSVVFEEECYRAIETVLNHPAFAKCYSVEDFARRAAHIQVLHFR